MFIDYSHLAFADRTVGSRFDFGPYSRAGSAANVILCAAFAVVCFWTGLNVAPPGYVGAVLLGGLEVVLVRVCMRAFRGDFEAFVLGAEEEDEEKEGTAPPEESARIVEQRIRNHVIDYLRLAGSFELQEEYARAVPIAYFPYEMINQWEDSVHVDPGADPHLSAVYSPQEAAAMKSFHRVWDRTADALPDDYPPMSQVLAMKEWSDLRIEANAALAVFEVRGPMPEDHEVDW